MKALITIFMILTLSPNHAFVIVDDIEGVRVAPSEVDCTELIPIDYVRGSSGELLPIYSKEQFIECSHLIQKNEGTIVRDIGGFRSNKIVVDELEGF